MEDSAFFVSSTGTLVNKEVLAMPRHLWSSKVPLVCQRRFEQSRVEQQLWSEAYEQLVPEGRRRPLAAADSAVRGRKKRVQGLPVVSNSLGEKCA
jgi:hypothetical protein